MRSAISHASAALLGGVTTAVVYYKLSSLTIESKHDNELSLKPKTSIVAGISKQSPALPIAVFHPNPNLEIAFDTRTRNPLYVLETLTKENLTSNTKNTADRQGQRFTEETSLLENHRSRNGYYRRSGYDRGHLAPAADFPSELESTFTLCNVSPQVSSFNRSIWAKLEALVRKVAREDVSDTTYVVTGPLWLPSEIIKPSNNNLPLKYRFHFEGIGTPPSLVYVPTHFFKLIVVSNNQGLVQKFAAFILPNKELKKHESKNLSHFVVKITDLEAVSGISFSPLMEVFSKSSSGDLTTEEVKEFVDYITHGILQENSNSTNSRKSLIGDNTKELILSSKSGIKKPNGKKLKEFKKYVRHLCDD